MDETSDAQDFFDCTECGHRAFWTSTGVAHHYDEDQDAVDHRADGDHVAYGESEQDAPVITCEACAGTGTAGAEVCPDCRGTGVVFEPGHAFA